MRPGLSDDEMLTRCEQVMREVCGDFGAELREFNGELDHVHLLVHHPPTFTQSRLVNSLKGVCSRRLRQGYTGQFNQERTAGQCGPRPNFAASCGGAPLEILKEHIREQKHPDQARAHSRA